MVKRHPIPDTKFPPEVTRRLYGRFHGIRNKAKTKQIPFSWDHFTDFFNDLMEVAPDDYSPDEYRMRFDLGLGVGYDKESMMLARVGESGKDAKSQMDLTKVKRSAAFETELAILLLTEEGPVGMLAEKAHNAVN